MKSIQKLSGNLIVKAMKRVLFIVLAALCVASCTKYEQQDTLPQVEYGQLRACFAEQTRTYVEGERFLRWHQKDELSVFHGDAVNNKYRFNGETGDSNGTFALILDGSATGTKTPIDRIYALYPRDESAEWVGGGCFLYTLPSVQYYQAESFGQNSNTMIAVTESTSDDLLMFKNVCGYLKVQLYGDATIKNLVLKTNGGEKISGLAYVSAEYGKDPAISMAGGGVNMIKLDCGDGVKVSESSDNPTDFWFVVPPTTFSEGITVTATDVNGKTFTKSTNSRFAIGRNALQPMAALYVKCDAAPVAVMEIKYTATEKLSVPSLEDKIVLHTFDGATGEGVIGLDSIITLFDEFWFKQNKALTSIVIPNGVTTIDDTAFSWCTELSEITIPSSVTEIGYGAFNYTGKIKRVNITDIDAWCRISFGNNYYATPFYNGARLYVNGEELTVLNVPQDVKKVDDYAFYGCQSLTEVNIPNSVEYVGYYAFYDCDNLKKVTLGEKVNYVGQSAFSGDTSLSVIHCRALTPPEIPLTIFSDGSFFEPYSYYDNYGSVHKIIVPLALLDAYKIAYKDNYASVVFPDVEPELTGDNVIYYQSKDCSIVTPNQAAYFGANILSNTYENGWGKIVFDGNVTEIGINAFAKSLITSIIIPKTVTIIGANAFEGSSLVEVHIPKSVTIIESNAFLDASNLRVVHIDDIASWCNIEFDSTTANPLHVESWSRKRLLYIDGEPVKDIVIPQSVTAIKNYTFYNYQAMGSIFIHKDVKSIGKEPFYNCAGELFIDCSIADYEAYATPFNQLKFTKLTFGDNVESVGNCAVMNCKAITEVVLGKNIKRLSGSAFSGCANIHQVEICGDLVVDINPFTGCGDLERFVGKNVTEDGHCWIANGVLMAFADADIREYTIPDYVKEIGNAALYGCSLYQVSLPEGLTRIGEYAFSQSSLETITIPSSVTEIGDYAFYYMRRFTSVVIPDSVTSLGVYAFNLCDKLVSAVLGKGVTQIGEGTFSGCTSLARATISGEVTSIGKSAFNSCGNLARITLPQSLTNIGSAAFSGCTALKTVNIPQSVSTIGESAFYNCSSLESVELGDLITRVEKDTFRECRSLKSFTCGKGVTYFGSYAFQNCSNQKSVYISDLAVWCGATFYDNTASPIVPGKAKLYVNGVELNEFVAPAGVTKINSRAFMGCSSITKVVDMADVTTVGNRAFCDCANLVSANLEGVRVLNDYALNTCPLLATVHLGSDIKTIERWTFYSANSSLTEIYCRATTPPSIYHNSNYGYGSFPYSAEMKFYVPREAVDNYLQFTACKDGRYVDNWYLYRDNIVPYDFE